MSMLFIIIWVIISVALPLFEKSDGTSLSYLTHSLRIFGKLLAKDGNNHSRTNQSTEVFPRPHAVDQADLEPESPSLQAQSMKPALAHAQCSSARLPELLGGLAHRHWLVSCLPERTDLTVHC